MPKISLLPNNIRIQNIKGFKDYFHEASISWHVTLIKKYTKSK